MRATAYDASRSHRENVDVLWSGLLTVSLKARECSPLLREVRRPRRAVRRRVDPSKVTSSIVSSETTPRCGPWLDERSACVVEFAQMNASRSLIVEILLSGTPPA
ncbi:MAG: hypothetical protein M3R53_08655 [Candidatus Eremiobacteraeota bacterium]|nr:hypothetical protein [Candidatus Eremiobacteraeota bacterium]